MPYSMKLCFLDDKKGEVTLLPKGKGKTMASYVVMAIPVFFLLIGIELIAMRLERKEVYRFNDSINDLSCGMTEQIMGLFVAVFLYAGYSYTYLNYAFFKIPTDSILVWTILFLGVDFCYYCFHRCSHSMNIGWASHIVHHQSEEYNLSVALRQGAFQKFISWFFYLPLALIGFDPRMILTIASINTLYQFWIHTRLIGKLGPLEWFLNTPSHHRVHHGRDDKYLDKNFAGVFIIWDRFFGTFQEEEEEPIFGITRPLNSWNPVWANFHQWVALCRNAYHTPKWIDKIKIWFMPPSWRPEGLPPDPPPILDRNNYEKYDPQISTGLSLYIFAQFLVIFGSTLFLLYYKKSMAFEVSFFLSTFIIFSLFNIGALFDKKKWAWFLENIRLLVCVGLILMFFPAKSILLYSACLAMATCCIWLRKYRMEFAHS